MPDGVDPLSIAGWLLRGAIREDDVPFSPLITDDPVNDIRVRHHFYDPVYNRALTKGIALGQKAPDWSLGTVDFLANPPQPNNNRDTGNHYTILDAREAMFRALTLKAKNPNGTYTDLSPSGSLKTKNDVRNAYWTTTFRALGDVVHLVEDMGQPQHTRNDIHCGTRFDGSSGWCGHKSVYESYIEARATGGIFTTVGSTNPASSQLSFTATPLDYGNYPIPTFTDYRSFFTTRQSSGGDNLLTRQGLADYSNRSFFSASKNYDNTEYVYPKGFVTGSRDVPTNWEGGALPPGTTTTFLVGTLPDNPGEITFATWGLWDQFLQTTGTRPSYTLTKNNYDDMAKLLIPRAVAYSAGLLNYFFRGRIEAEDVSFTDTGLTLRVRNTIDLAQTPQYAGESLVNGATLIVAYDYLPPNAKSEVARMVGSSDPVALTENLKPDQSSLTMYSFTIPPIPANATDVHYRLVYRGRLGKEDDAVVAQTIEPTSGFLVSPNYAPADGLSGISQPRLVYRAWGKWRLSPKTDLQAGNIDWKGWYDANGRPTKVLSWEGPVTRYFENILPNGGISLPGFGPNIYQDGDVFAVVPMPVLGAAVQRDSSGYDWLVVVCKDSSADVVYRRPYKKSFSRDLYDPVTAPDGWQLLGRFPQEGFYVGYRPWFFNGDGTEAQTVRNLSNPDNTVTPARYKITINNGSAQRQTLGNAGIQMTESCDVKIPPTTVYPCPGGAEGHYKDEWTRTGSVVIAADYVNNQERLAVVSDDRALTDNTSVTLSGSLDANGNCITRGVHTNNVIETGSLKLTIGSASLNLTKNAISVSEKYTGWQFPFAEASNESATVKDSWAMEHDDVNYIDLRYSLRADALSKSSSAARGSAQSLNYPYTFPIVYSSSYDFNRGVKSDLGNHSIVKAPTQSTSTQIIGYSNLVWGLNRDTTCISANRIEYPDADKLIKQATGSWVADVNNNLLITQSYQDQNGNPGLFNFLSQGDLTKIIPGAPAAGAFFDPAELIR